MQATLEKEHRELQAEAQRAIDQCDNDRRQAQEESRRLRDTHAAAMAEMEQETAQAERDRIRAEEEKRGLEALLGRLTEQVRIMTE